MKYLFLILLLTACASIAEKKIYAVVNGEVLNPGWYICEFGVLYYRGGDRRILNLKGDPIACERAYLTQREYCNSKRPVGAYAKGC